MSAFEVTDKLETAIRSGQYQAMICNYANGDMVGHSGIMEAAVKAIEALDVCIGRVVNAMLECGGEVLITADHAMPSRCWIVPRNKHIPHIHLI